MKQNSTNLSTRIIGIALAILLFASWTIVAPLTKPANTNAQSLDQLRARTAELEKEINANKAQADQLRSQGDSLKTAIATLDLQIAEANTQIELTSNKIIQLGEELKQAQIELDRQKELLRANMRALYKRGDASAVELIVGSDSFSQYIDEQEYLERLKLGIHESTQKVLALKQKIEAQKNEQEALKKQQLAAREMVRKAKNQQAILLAETQGRENVYRQRTAALEDQQKKLLSEIVSRSRVISGVGTGSYPWAGYREGAWTHGGSCNYGDDIDPWGYCFRQCVSFAAWRVYSAGKTPPKFFGNAENWNDAARSKGIATGSEPRVGAVAVWEGYEGHVAFVEEVYGNGQVRISEFNAVPALQGRYSQRVISASDPADYIYF